MTEITIAKIIEQYRSIYPELRNLTDKEILSVINNTAQKINLNEAERISVFGLPEQGFSGLDLEKQNPKLTIPDKSVLETALRERINKVDTDTKAAEKNNSWIGKAWSWTKNTFGIGDSSNKVREKREKELKALNSGNIEAAFKEITGLDYTAENVNRFLNNEVKTTSEQALDGYKEGQDMVSDIAGDIISGIAAVGIYAAAIAASPFTGGTSIALGIAAATASGALIKSGIKALDTVGTDKKYDSFQHDLITGGFSGLLAPITGGLGGAVGKTIATKTGVQVLKHSGEKAAESGIKAMLTNPAGYQYVGETLLKRSSAIAAEMAVDGAIGGAVDTAFRTGVEQVEQGNDIDLGEIGMSALEGGIGGLVIAPVIGGGMRGAGKVTGNLHNKKLELNAFRDNAEQSLLRRIKDGNSPKEIELVNAIKNKITSKNKALIEMMLEDETITNEQILSIINSLTKTSPLHPAMQIPTAGIISNIHFKNNSLRIKYAKDLLQNQNITNDQIPAILENLYGKNSRLLDTMLARENFESQSISDILRNSFFYDSDGMRVFPKCREKLALKLIENPEFPDSYISDILGKTYNTNLKLIEKICAIKDFPKDHISTLLDNILYNRNGRSDFILENNTGYKIKLTEQLLDDSNCPKNIIADIIGAIDSKQAKLFEQLNKDEKISKSEIASILHLQNGLRKGEKLSFAEKVLFLTNATNLETSTLKYLEKYNISSEKVNNLINNIALEMGMKKNKIDIDADNIKTLYRNFINNRGDIDRIITRINPEQIQKGIPLRYPRQKFISDIEHLLKNINETDRNAILNYFGITLSKGNFEGIPIIPKDSSLNFKEELKPIVTQIKTKIEEFTLNNETTIADSELKTLFDSIIKGCPEFTTIIGKIQHGTHQYSVDVHTLKVLQNAIKDPAYQQLSDADKTALKFAILLHDIGKKGGVVDSGHYEASAKYAIGILDRYNLTPRTKSRILEIIYNHHWFEQFNKNKINANYVNAIFRSPEDLQIAMLMAKSDLMGVNNDFHFRVTGTKNIEELNSFFERRMIEIMQAQDTRYSKMNLVMDTKFVQTAERSFPVKKVMINGEEKSIAVLNLTDPNVTDDLYQYGFAKGTTKESARFLVHMNDKIKGLKVFLALSSSPVTESIQSFSLISLANNRTYRNQIYGVITDLDMANVAQASNTNIASGYRKTLKTFARDLYSPLHTVTYVRDNMLEFLANNGIKLSPKEYAELSEQLVNIQYTSQITKDIKIGDKTIKADLLREAFDWSCNQLFEGNLHSEIVGINPRVKALVARTSSIENCSPEFLSFAAENNLPVILIGFKNPV